MLAAYILPSSPHATSFAYLPFSHLQSPWTNSAPLLATILILFGIGYTIDYNSGYSGCLFLSAMFQMRWSADVYCKDGGQGEREGQDRRWEENARIIRR